MPEVLVRAHAHKGASLVEILQNCIIYHDGAFGPLGEKATAPDAGIRLKHGEPMLYGKAKDKGLVFDESACRFRIAQVGVDAPLEAVARHDETNLPRAIALASLGGGDEPTAIGVIYARPLESAHSGFAELAPTPAMSRDQLAALLAGRAAG
jgi:2-oxoglutarate/2-oxoacid ferredoxin oxidoreductase subunit beta